MRKIYLIIFLQVFVINAKSQCNNDTIMIERFNYKAVEGLSPPSVLLQEGDWLIGITYYNYNKSGTQREYAPAREFYHVQKAFHPNGVISRYTKLMGSVAFGERKFYNEKGEITEIIDEDAKFGKIKPRDFVNILEKIGWINRKTGENIVTKEPLKTDGTFTMRLRRLLEIRFFPAEYGEDGKEIKPPVWRAGYVSGNIQHYCYVDGNTGEYKFDKFSFQIIL